MKAYCLLCWLDPGELLHSLIKDSSRLGELVGVDEAVTEGNHSCY